MLDSDAYTDRVAEILEAHRGLEGPLLPILHAIQHAFGHVPDSAIPQIAAALTLSKAEVHGVVSFYHDFRDAPAGKHVIKLCRAEACQAVGADAVAGPRQPEAQEAASRPLSCETCADRDRSKARYM